MGFILFKSSAVSLNISLVWNFCDDHDDFALQGSNGDPQGARSPSALTEWLSESLRQLWRWAGGPTCHCTWYISLSVQTFHRIWNSASITVSRNRNVPNCNDAIIAKVNPRFTQKNYRYLVWLGRVHCWFIIVTILKYHNTIPVVSLLSETTRAPASQRPDGPPAPIGLSANGNKRPRGNFTSDPSLQPSIRRLCKQ